MVHSSAVATTSQYFQRLVNGGLAEAEKRSANLKDIESDDFVRFLEYAYRRDYTVPSWTCDKSAQIASNVEPPSMTDTIHEKAVPPISEPTRSSVVPRYVPQPMTLSTSTYRNGLHNTASKKKEENAKANKSVLQSEFQKRNYFAKCTPTSDLTDDFRPTNPSAAQS